MVDTTVRSTLPFCVFHPRCETGLSALEQYRRGERVTVAYTLPDYNFLKGEAEKAGRVFDLLLCSDGVMRTKDRANAFERRRQEEMANAFERRQASDEAGMRVE